MSDPLPDEKLSLAKFLQLLTSNNVPALKAVAVASKVYNQYNTRRSLSQLTDSKLKSAGVTDKEDRKLVLTALRQSVSLAATSTSGSMPIPGANLSRPHDRYGGAAQTGFNHSGTSLLLHNKTHLPSRNKRKREGDLNEFLPDRMPEGGEACRSLDFNELVDEKIRMSKSTVINRAPIITAWSFIVAERLGFQREEALSIATVFTEMNAISKGIRLGVRDKDKGEGVSASRGNSQPYVDLMGRRMYVFPLDLPDLCAPPASSLPRLRPLYRASSGQWRALSAGAPVAPTAAFSYITRTLKQTTPQIMGALRLLGSSYAPAELNDKGFGLYAEFRPHAEGWGKRGEVRCSKILSLRKERDPTAENKCSGEGSDITETTAVGDSRDDKMTRKMKVHETEEPDKKKARGMALEEYEAALVTEEFLYFGDCALDMGADVELKYASREQE